MTTKKSRLLPRSANPVGSRPAAKATKAAVKPAKGRKGPTKADQLVAMLLRKRGASIEELVAKFGTQPHSLRAQISITRH